MGMPNTVYADAGVAIPSCPERAVGRPHGIFVMPMDGDSASDDKPVIFEERVLKEDIPLHGGYSFKYVFKIVLIGESGVGKTCLIHRLVHPDEEFQERNPTLGADFFNHAMSMQDRCEVRLQLWDTAGAVYARDQVLGFFNTPLKSDVCDAAIICFRSGQAESLESAKQWLHVVRSSQPQMPVLLCGTMVDIENAQVSNEDVREIAVEADVMTAITSAKSNFGVTEAFLKVAASLYEAKETQRREGCGEQHQVQKAAREVQQPTARLTKCCVTREPGTHVQNEYQFKFLLIGATGVGKSSFLTRFAEDLHDFQHNRTVLPECASTDLYIAADKITCRIWDMPGWDIGSNVPRISPEHYKGTIGILLMFDVTSRSSLDSLDSYVDYLPDRAVKHTLLLGNKCDLTHDIQVSAQEAQAWAKAHGMEYLGISARQRTGVEDAMFSLTSAVHEDTARTAHRLHRQADLFGRQFTPPWFARHDVSNVMYTEEQLRYVFDKLDPNEDGYIQCDDFNIVNRGFGEIGLSQMDVAAVLEQSRLHSIGKLSFDEFAILMLKVAKC